MLRLSVAYLNATINVKPEMQNRRLELTVLAKPGETRGLRGLGPGLARQESAGRDIGRFWSRTDLFLRSKPGPIADTSDQNATAAMALTYREVIINAARTVDKGVIDVEENESRDMLKVHAVPLVRYIGKDTEGLPKMREEIHAEYEGVVIPLQVRWLANHHSIMDTRPRREISAFYVVFVVMGDKVVRRLIKAGVKAAEEWY
jgi:hypothetical protein